MAVYTVQYKVDTNVEYDKLTYELELYKGGYNSKEYVLPNTGKQDLMPDYKTQVHNTIDIPEGESTIYILKITLYRKSNSNSCIKEETSIYSLGDYKGDNSSRKGISYHVTTGSTKEVKNGEVNIVQQCITRRDNGLFESSQHPHGDKIDPFKFDEIKKEIDSRALTSLMRPINNFLNYPYQKRTMLCGPAVFTYCLMMDRIDLYQQAIWDLYQTGQTRLGSLLIKASSDIRKPDDLFGTNKKTGVEEIRIPAIDWIFMASLMDSSNIMWDMDSTYDLNAGVTAWWTIEKWFTAVGAKKIFDNIRIAGSKISDLTDLNDYIDTSNNSTHVVELVSASMMSGEDYAGKDHWIAWEGELEEIIYSPSGVKQQTSRISSMTSLDVDVELNFFSWGKVKRDHLTAGTTLKNFLKCSFGGMVFTKIP